ncbi:MAG: HNH endonuclease [Candidatus Sericytochromatia bacterium]|nr:HNH endonuclease [Candidatus Sericytochromatia bacterium]
MQVLVLSSSYQPLYTCGVERAIRLLYLGKAVSVKDSDEVMRSPSVVMRVPSAIRLLVKAVVHRYYDAMRPTRQAIFRRDGQACQYCGSHTNLTLDHVIPRAKGGKDTWENLVAACVSCNNKKGDRRPEEVNMRLMKTPKPPAALELSHELWNKLMGW